MSTSGSHKWPPIATGSFFAQVAVAVAPDDPHHVCSLARPPPSPCPIAFTDFIFPCRAPYAELRGGGGLRVFDVLDPNGRCSIPQLQLLVPCKRKTTPSHPPTPRISNQTPVPLTPTFAPSRRACSRRVFDALYLGAVDAGVHLPAWGKQEPRAGTLWAALRIPLVSGPVAICTQKNGRRVAAVHPARARFVYSSVCNSHLLTHLKGAAC